MIRQLRLTAGLLAGAIFVSVLTAYSEQPIESALAETAYTAEEAQNPYLLSHTSNLNYKTINGQALAYLDFGPREGRTVILLHGIPTSSLLYRDVAEEIASNGYRVIAVDLLGFGASDKPTDKSLYTFDSHSARVFALADELGIDNFVLGVHDVGGIIGWSMLQQNENRIDGIIMANTMAGLAGVTPSPLVMKIMTQEATPEQIWSQLDDVQFAQEATRMFMLQGFSDENLIPDGLIEAYAAPLNDGSRYAFTALFENMPVFMQSEPARREAMASFGKPTAIIFGEQDKFYDANVVVPDLKESMGTSDNNITLVPSSGHFVQEQAPQAYIDAVVTFLDDNF